MANESTDYLGNIVKRAEALAKAALALKTLEANPMRYRTEGTEDAIQKQRMLVLGAWKNLEDAHRIWLDPSKA